MNSDWILGLLAVIGTFAGLSFAMMSAGVVYLIKTEHRFTRLETLLGVIADELRTRGFAEPRQG